jgi:hypothetical protein
MCNPRVSGPKIVNSIEMEYILRVEFILNFLLILDPIGAQQVVYIMRYAIFDDY